MIDIHVVTLLSISLHSFLYLQEISLADFIQLAGVAAIENGMVKAGIPIEKMKLEFKAGRIDCPWSPADIARHKFPDPNFNRKQMMEWFADTRFGYGMNEQEV